MINTVFSLYPLQVSVTDFKVDNSSNVLYFIIFITIIIILIIIASLAKKGTSGSGSGSSGSKIKLFSGFAFHRLAKNIGLNHEQIKMLDYVFKTDDVLDPEKSLVTPALLDRHFKRAYRVIEQTSSSPNDSQRRHAVLFSTRNFLENSAILRLTSTHQIKEDTILTITHGRDKINVSVLVAKGDFLVVETPKTILGSQVKISKGTKISVLFFTKSNKGFSFETRVTGYSTYHGHATMLLAHTNQLRFLSQRRFRRRQVVIACSMNLVYVEGSGKKQRLVVDKRRINGNITDISVGGCSIKAATPVQVGVRFKIEFTQSEKKVAALGQVLRTNRAGVVTIIHIKFLRVTQKSMNLINAFVYEYAND
jgi:ribosomal 50S subunit-recycling heat shock protein